MCRPAMICSECGEPGRVTITPNWHDIGQLSRQMVAQSAALTRILNPGEGGYAEADMEVVPATELDTDS
jgi:hypothetical protein